MFLNSKNFSDLEGNFSVKNIDEFQNLSKYLNEIGFTDLKDKYSIMCDDCGAKEITIFMVIILKKQFTIMEKMQVLI